MSFLVLALPRSRTKWLSKFLTYGDWWCGHEELRHMRSLDDVKAFWRQDYTGTAETAAAPFWRLITEETKLVLIRRPVDEVVDSLWKLPIAFERPRLEAVLAYHNRKLDQIAARLPCLQVAYGELEDEAACAAIFKHCLGLPHDHSHWASLAPVNVQCNMPALMRHMQAFPMGKLAAQAKHRTLANMAQKPVQIDGMTFQCETFDTWVNDAQHLFAEHLCQVDEAPDAWQHKNLPLMRKLYDAGAMQIMTARSNGRMFGYLMSVISWSLTSESVMSAANTTFFASPDAPGLGLKLQRAALESLKARGVDHVFWEAGSRGSGPRLGAMYRRLGANDHGQTYRLQLAGM